MGTLVAVNHFEDASEATKEKIAEVNEGFISMKGNLKILKKLGEKFAGK